MLYLAKLKKWLADTLFPPTCLNCKIIVEKKDEGLCHACFAAIPINKTLFCGVCHARLPNNNGTWLTTRKICHKNAPYILAAATDYKNKIVRNLVWRLKYRQKKQAALPLARILAAYLNLLDLAAAPSGQSFNRNIVVCSVPLHPKRERERGFNQSRLIATHLTSLKDVNIIDHILIRVKNTPPQAEIGDSQKRKENMESSFSLYLPASSNPIRPIGPICPINPIEISGKNIILLDDVSTSGATLTEAARVLKSTGAKRIIALVIAKA